MTYYYVCVTSGCKRNKPGLHRKAETVSELGHSLCSECGKPMVRRQRPLKGPNVKLIPTNPVGRSKAATGKSGRKPASVKKLRRKL
jgi:hypothetical protein